MRKQRNHFWGSSRLRSLNGLFTPREFLYKYAVVCAVLYTRPVSSVSNPLNPRTCPMKAGSTKYQVHFMPSLALPRDAFISLPPVGNST